MDDIERIYKDLFGSPKYMTFVDDSYKDLRQQIVNLPYERFESEKLPFEGVNFTRRKVNSVNVLYSSKILRDIPKAEIAFLLSSLKSHLVINEFVSDVGSLVWSLHPTRFAQQHIFYLYSPNCCRAYGYYNIRNNEFTLLKGSLVAKRIGTTYEMLRNQMIKNYCTVLKDYYMLHSDYVCRSATTAASFALGRVGSIKQWIDKDGKTLSEVYLFK